MMKHKKEPEEETSGYNEEYYNEIIQDNEMSFTKDDIDCINQLLSAEINDNTLDNITEYAVTPPLKVELPSKEKNSGRTYNNL